jgi:hypothetical protein
LTFSGNIADPEFSVYPSRIVYQAADDTVSLYVVSFRMPDKTGHVKLLKIEGVGKGRWFEVPLARSADEKGKVVPGLMTDFMVVPQASTSLVWWYVGEVLPIFEGATRTDYERMSPAGIQTAFAVAREGFNLMPSESSQITKETFNEDVISNATSALLLVIYALDSVAAAYDTSNIGLHAYEAYFLVGRDLFRALSNIFDVAIPTTGDDRQAAQKIVDFRNEVVRKGTLHNAYMLRAEIYTVWDVSVNLGPSQNTWRTMRRLMGDLLELIHNKKDELLKQGHKEADLVSAQSLASAYVTRYDNVDDKFWSQARSLFSENGGTYLDVFGTSFTIPLFLRENEKTIARELELLNEPASASVQAGLIYLSGLGQKVISGIKKISEQTANLLPGPIKTRKAATVSLSRQAAAVEILRKHINDEILKHEILAIEYLINIKGVPDVAKLLGELARVRSELTAAEGKLNTLERELKDLEDMKAKDVAPGVKDNKRTDIKNTKAAISGFKARIKDIEGQFRYPTDVNFKGWPDVLRLETYFKLIEPRTQLSDSAKHDEKIEAELKILTSIVSNDNTIRHFTIGVRDSFAEFMFLYRHIDIPPAAWFEVFESARGKITPTLTFVQIAKEAQVQIDKEIRELGTDAAAISDLVEKVKIAANGADSISAGMITDVMPHLKNRPGFGRDAVRTKLEVIASWENFSEKISEGMKKTTNLLEAASERALTLEKIRTREEGTRAMIPFNVYNDMSSRTAGWNGFWSKDKDDKKTSIELLIERLVSPTDDFGKTLSKTDEGNALQRYLSIASSVLKDRALKLKASFEKDYDAFKAGADLDSSGKRKLTEANQEAIIREFNELETAFTEFTTNLRKAETMARQWEWLRAPIFRAWEILKDLLNLPGGPGMRALGAIKSAGPVAMAMAAIPGTLYLMAQTGLILGIGAAIGLPGVEIVRNLYNGIVGTASGALGGDPGQASSPPAAGKSSGSLLPLLGFGVAIAMVTGGKSVFDAIGKTLGGFFQFATALLPGAKKIAAKGAGPGGGGGRRGPKFDVDKWIEKLEMAQHRLEKAKGEGNKGAERREQDAVDKAIQNLKRAKDEGEDVPDGLWNLGSFNWLG